MIIEQYRVYQVDLDPIVGSEIGKVRPCVVVSPDPMNRHLKTIVVIPITSTIKAGWPTRFEVSTPAVTGQCAVDQITTLDKRRFIRKVAHLNQADTVKLKDLIHAMLVAD